MWMKRLSSKVKKVAVNPEPGQTIDGVKVGEPTIVSGKVIEVPNSRAYRGSKPLDQYLLQSLKRLSKKMTHLEKAASWVGCPRIKRSNKIIATYRNKTSEAPTLLEPC